MKSKARYLAVLAAAVPLAFAACDDTDSVMGPSGAEAGFSVVFAPESGGTSSISYMVMEAPGELAAARVSLESVSSIVLPIGEVEALSADGGWVAAGSIDAEVDLMALPEEGIELLDSELPMGSYEALRFWLTADATITLAAPVRVGRTTFEAGAYPLEIPSEDNNGVRLHSQFEVDGDGQVLTVLVDEDASIRKVIATGSGVLKISPVLNVRNQQGQHVGGNQGQGPNHGDGHGPGQGQNGNEVEGYVAEVDAAEGKFSLEDGTIVEVSGETELTGDFLTLEDVAAAVNAGEAVEAEVHGPLAEDGVTILARRVEFETDDDDGDGDTDDDDGEVELRGPVTGLDRAGQTFTMMYRAETVTVVIDGETELEFDDGYTSWDDVADAFEAGTTVRAEVEGDWNDSGDLLADKAEFGEPGQGGPGGPGGPGHHGYEAEGLVESVNLDAGTFVLDDNTVVQVSSDTEISGDFTTLADVSAALADGVAVEAEAHGPRAEDGTTILATEVEFEVEEDGDDDEVEVRGPITGIDADGMTFTLTYRMESVTVIITDDTELEFDDPYASWAEVVAAVGAGTTVRAEAEGSWNDDGSLVASEVEFEEPGGHGGGQGSGGQGSGGQGGGGSGGQGGGGSGGG